MNKAITCNTKTNVEVIDRRVSPKIRQFRDLGSASTFLIVDIIKEYISIL